MTKQRKLNDELRAAVYAGAVELVHALLAAGADSNAESEEYPPILRTAIVKGDAEIVKLLVSAGADVNYEWSCCSPLHLAIAGGQCWCSKCDPTCECEFSFDSDVYHYLQVEGSRPHSNRGIVQLLLDAGAEATPQNDVGLTALNLAIATGDAETVKALVKAGADVNGADDFGITPLNKVARLRQFIEFEIEPVDEDGIADTIEWIIKPPDLFDFEVDTGVEDLTHGGNQKRSRRRYPKTRVFHAAARGDAAELKSLIIAGADVHSAKTNGVTPLHVAALNGHAETVEVLLWAGVNVDPRDASGHTPLYQVSGVGDTEVARLLLKSGADPNASNRRGETPLWFARRRGHAEIVRMLVNSGAT